MLDDADKAVFDSAAAAYRRGEYEEAINGFRVLAEKGHAVAQFYLGVMYATGQGVAQDDVQAHLWHNLAAAQGKETARKARAAVAERMTPAQIVEALRLVREWRKKK